MLVISGPVAVDSFFLLSGILVTFHLYKEIDTRLENFILSVKDFMRS